MFLKTNPYSLRYAGRGCDSSTQSEGGSFGPRAGFTLIELLAVIVVISILIALLLPAINGARRRATIAQVRTEISAIESACVAFEKEYGAYPPSTIILFEDGSMWNSPPATPPLNFGYTYLTNAEREALWQRMVRESKATLRQFWPQFNFNHGLIQINHYQPIDPSRPPNDPINYPQGEILILSNAECLSFFLGGLPEYDEVSKIWKTIGFSKDPANPFRRSGGPRTTLFYSHPSNRFTDYDLDGSPEFLDPISGQSIPYFYAAALNGSYQPASFGNVNDFTLPMRPYCQDLNNQTPWKTTSCQIVSPGYDRTLGPGGSYKESTPFLSPYSSSAKPSPAWPNLSRDVTASDRNVEEDNITNFASGTLGGQ